MSDTKKESGNVDCGSLLRHQEYVKSETYMKKTVLVNKAFYYLIETLDCGPEIYDKMTNAEKEKAYRQYASEFEEAAEFFEKLRIYLAE